VIGAPDNAHTQRKRARNNERNHLPILAGVGICTCDKCADYFAEHPSACNDGPRVMGLRGSWTSATRPDGSAIRM
jgi:hypothetical protein